MPPMRAPIAAGDGMVKAGMVKPGMVKAGMVNAGMVKAGMVMASASAFAALRVTSDEVRSPVAVVLTITEGAAVAGLVASCGEGEVFRCDAAGELPARPPLRRELAPRLLGLGVEPGTLTGLRSPAFERCPTSSREPPCCSWGADDGSPG